MHGHVVSLGVPITVREISLGGLSMETPFSFPVGATHEFSLTLGDESAMVLRGKVVYCREGKAPDGSPLYVTGVQFIEDDPTADTAVGGLIDKIS
jgi:hypothetical protein